jgi:tetratricopeptide (TPR) repeat protein
MLPSKHSPALMILVALIFAGCSSQNNNSKDQLGDIHFTVTGKEEAQPVFEKAVLLLHSFEYVDAAEEFQKVQKIDPGFVMAYWGEAMSYNHPLWQEQDFDKGNMVLSALAPTPEERIAKAKTALEKDFIGGINILYGNGNKAERDSSYAMHMESLYRKYPGNDEVAAFFSLALNGWGTTEKDISILEKAAVIGHEIVQRNPKHPGALHYIIHALDDPQHAAQALVTADNYAKTAPGAGHALHMPTHTYLALGLWDRVVSSNEVSWAAEWARKKRKNLDNDALGYHSYHWLLYGHLQLGNKEKARPMIDSVQKYSGEKSSPRARAHMILMKTTYLAETNDYSKSIMDITIRHNDLNIVAKSKNYFAQGMSEYHLGNAARLDKVILQLAGERLAEASNASGKGIRLCGNIGRSMPTVTDLQESEAMEMELRAMRAWLAKDAIATEKYFQKATALQTSAGYSYGPPAIAKPTFEMYGEWLLETGRAKEALTQFETSLHYAPNRLLSLKGKKTAEKQLKSNGVAAL